MADTSHLFQIFAALDRMTLSELQWVTLRPWREDSLRQWMDDVGFQDDSDIRREVIDRTGGWPSLLTRLYDLVQLNGGLKSGLDKLESEMMAPPTRDRLIRSFGLDDPVKKKVLRLLAEFEYADRGGLAAVLADDGVDAGSLQRILQWAELLHLVRRVEEDSWQADGVVAKLLTAGTGEG